MARLMCIATHHKCGTVWMRQVVTAISEAIGVPWFGIWNDAAMPKVPDEGRAFLVNWEGAFPQALWEREDIAVLHLIRDPRDVLLSGCVYHHLAGEKGELWLHEPRAEYGGLTYQDKLRAIADDNEKLRFEMDGKHRETVEQMRAWPWGDARVCELRYEDLIADQECRLFRSALAHLGLSGDELEKGVRSFWKHSLFGGLAEPDDRPDHVHAHVSSGGQVRRWQTELPRSVGEVYAGRHGSDLIALGYETDMRWVGQLPEQPGAREELEGVNT